MVNVLNWKVKNALEKTFKDDRSVDEFLYTRIGNALQKMYDLGHADGYSEYLLDRDSL